MTGLRAGRRRVSSTKPQKNNRIGKMESDSSGEEAQAALLPAPSRQPSAAVPERSRVRDERSRTGAQEQEERRGRRGALRRKVLLNPFKRKSADAELPAGLLPAALPSDAESAALVSRLGADRLLARWLPAAARLRY